MASIRRAVVALAVPLFGAGNAQTESSSPKTFFTSKDAVLGVAFVATSVGLSVFDARIARFFQDTALLHVRTGQRLDDIFTHINETTLTVGGLATYVVARVAKQKTLADVAFHTAEAVAAASLTSQVIRGPLGRARPRDAKPAYENQYDFNAFAGFRHFQNRAFPSIHSSSGFAAASAIVAEVSRRNPGATWAVAVPAYALALTPGLSRMYLGQHWASDIMAGALLGTFYGWRIVNYSHDHPTTRIDKLFLGRLEDAQLSRSEGGFTVGWTVKF